MKETPVKASPFSALNRQEQKEMWICWQCQQSAQTEAENVTRVEAEPLPTLKLPCEARTEPPPLRHSQYDAVLRRMERAGKRAVQYHSWDV